ncbi:hypothetical protein [[Limnothrix rosea] IAM M-220]|uniref:hypothetical protein n=1 Tax=[Limnothrix rosea] IAM M-220 TaxID=454133 RepID=UPI000A0030BA|nr:hypothetical protein [[Limnothrix rosea] IAM M-220]
MLIEPRLLRAAQHIYYNYANVHPVRAQYVTGVAIDRETYSGFVSFRQQAIILPREVFIRTEDLMSYQYQQLT